MISDKELYTFFETGLKRQGWTTQADTSGFDLIHNDYFLTGRVDFVQWEEDGKPVEGLNLVIKIGEEEFDFMEIDEFFIDLPSLKLRLQRILDSWRDCYRPIYNLLWKALELRRMAMETEDDAWFKQYKSVCDEAHKALNVFKQLEYYERN